MKNPFGSITTFRPWASRANPFARPGSPLPVAEPSPETPEARLADGAPGIPPNEAPGQDRNSAFDRWSAFWLKASLLVCGTAVLGLAVGAWEIHHQRRLCELSRQVRLAEQAARAVLSKQRVLEARMAMLCSVQLVQQIQAGQPAAVPVSYRSPRASHARWHNSTYRSL